MPESKSIRKFPVFLHYLFEAKYLKANLSWFRIQVYLGIRPFFRQRNDFQSKYFYKDHHGRHTKFMYGSDQYQQSKPSLYLIEDKSKMAGLLVHKQENFDSQKLIKKSLP